MTLLAQLCQRGLSFRATAGQLYVEPRSALTDPLRETIRANKTTILQELEAEAFQRVECELQGHPEHRYAFDIAGAPLGCEPGGPVSVVLAVRRAGRIVFRQFTVPRERWDFDAFVAALDLAASPSHDLLPADGNNPRAAGGDGRAGRVRLCRSERIKAAHITPTHFRALDHPQQVEAIRRMAATKTTNEIATWTRLRVVKLRQFLSREIETIRSMGKTQLPDAIAAGTGLCIAMVRETLACNSLLWASPEGPGNLFAAEREYVWGRLQDPVYRARYRERSQHGRSNGHTRDDDCADPPEPVLPPSLEQVPSLAPTPTPASAAS